MDQSVLYQPNPDPGREYWITADVAAYLNVKVGTVSSYNIRKQMPAPDRTEGRTHLWKPKTIMEWRPNGWISSSRS